MKSQKIFKYIFYLSVEPLGLFVFLAFHIYMTVMQVGLYKVVCFKLFGNNPNCQTKNFDKPDEEKIQTQLALWNQAFMLSFMIPGAITSILLGSWGDISGRKINLMLSLTGILIGVFPMVIIFTYKSTPLWIALVAHFIGGCMGFLSLIMVSSMAYLSDTVLDKEVLSIRMVCFSVLMSIATIIGSSICSALFEVIELQFIIVIVELLLAIGFFYSFFRLRQVPPKLMRELVLAEENKKNVDSNLAEVTNSEKSKDVNQGSTATTTVKNDNKDISCWKNAWHIISTATTLVVDVIRTYLKPRPQKRRGCLITITVVLFLKMLADVGMNSIMAQYVFKNPFKWSDSELGYWKSVSGACSFVGSMVGIVIYKKLIKFQDSTVMLIALLSGIGELIILGLAQTSWLLYLAVGIGCQVNLIMPIVGSFTTQLIDPDEVGKAFVMQGLVSSLAIILSNIVFNNLYVATLKFYPGFVFLFGAGILAVCFFLILWVHLSVIRKNVVGDNLDNKKNVVDETKL